MPNRTDQPPSKRRRLVHGLIWTGLAASSVAAGLAEAARLDGLDRRIFCIIGDGESREGQISEALDHIIDRGLTNVCPIFNCNQYGQAAKVSGQQSAERIAAKLTAYGYETITINGHEPAEIKKALDRYIEISGDPSATPVAIVAKTVKGWGSPSIQGGGWHAGLRPAPRERPRRTRRAPRRAHQRPQQHRFVHDPAARRLRVGRLHRDGRPAAGVSPPPARRLTRAAGDVL